MLRIYLLEMCLIKFDWSFYPCLPGRLLGFLFKALISALRELTGKSLSLKFARNAISLTMC